MTRAEVSRRNGRKSKGPATPEGKARSRRNALKHGILARTVCPRSTLITDREEFDCLLAGLLEDFRPRTQAEVVAVEAVALDMLREQRVRAMTEAELDPSTPDELDFPPASEETVQGIKAEKALADNLLKAVLDARPFDLSASDLEEAVDLLWGYVAWQDATLKRVGRQKQLGWLHDEDTMDAEDFNEALATKEKTRVQSLGLNSKDQLRRLLADDVKLPRRLHKPWADLLAALTNSISDKYYYCTDSVREATLAARNAMDSKLSLERLETLSRYERHARNCLMSDLRLLRQIRDMTNHVDEENV